MKFFNRMSCVIASVVFLTGCSAATAINKKYATVNRADGVTEKEAVVIAQHELLASELLARFHIKKVSILSDRLVEPYPDYVFVSFYPIAFDDHFWRYLVVIDKKTGVVFRAEKYQPLRNINYDWVFNGKKPR